MPYVSFKTPTAPFLGLLVLLLCSPVLIRADTTWNSPGEIVQGDSIAFFTHSSTKWDFDAHSSAGANRLALWARSRSIPLVYFKDNLDGTYYLKANPDYLFKSNSGEFIGRIGVVRNVYFAGAYFDACVSSTVSDVMTQLRFQPLENIKLTFITDAIRPGEEEMIKDPKVKLLSALLSLASLQSCHKKRRH